MAKKIFGIFSKKPIVWFHYLILTLLLFGANIIFSKWGLQNSGSKLLVFLAYYLVFAIGDQLIHKILKVD